MKSFFKENLIRLLVMILLGLLFILWGRIILSEIRDNIHIRGLTTTQARLDCLKSYGWEVDPGSETVRTAVVPDPLDSVYQSYNRLQTLCGFDLEKHRGKTIECYTYLVLNFPYETDDPVYVNLLIDDGTLIGGDCMSNAIDGFMLPLDRRYLP